MDNKIYTIDAAVALKIRSAVFFDRVPEMLLALEKGATLEQLQALVDDAEQMFLHHHHEQQEIERNIEDARRHLEGGE
tara:strand:- start:1489 stop:1722 length:234 start_codon:yes stop_codon:yes gene_type:complete